MMIDFTGIMDSQSRDLEVLSFIKQSLECLLLDAVIFMLPVDSFLFVFEISTLIDQMVKAGDVAFLPAINRRKPEENKSSRHNGVELRVYVYVCVCWCVWCACAPSSEPKKMSCE